METESKHTPWVVRGTAGHEKHGQSVVYDENDTRGHDIAIVYDGDAHGNLIASAPALLAALTALVDSPLTWLDGYKSEVDAAMMQARAAIAKAEDA